MTASIKGVFDALGEENFKAAEDLFAALPAELTATAPAHLALARIRAHQQRFPEAWQALHRATELGAAPLFVLRVTTHLQEAQKDNEGLLESLPRLIALLPDSPQPHIRLAKAQIATGLLSAAQDTLAAAQTLGGPEPVILSMLAQVQAAQGNSAALIQTRRRLVEIRPNQSASHLALAAALLAADDLPGALEANSTAQSLAEDKLAPLRQRVTILERSGDAEALVQTLDLMAGMNPDQLDHQLYLAQKQAKVGQTGPALQTALGVLALWPADIRGYELALTIANQPPAILSVLQKALDNLDQAPLFPGLMFKLAHVAIADSDRLIDAYCEKWPQDMGPRFGRVKAESTVPDELVQIFLSVSTEGRPQALQRLDQWLAQSPPPPTSQPRAFAREVVAALPEAHEVRRGAIVDDGQDVVISPAGDSGVTVLVFCGLAQRAGYDLCVIDRLMAAQGASAVYLRDLRLTYFLGGIRSLGPDRASMVTALRTILARLQTRKLVVLTSSGGGLGGIPAALDLGASRIVSMASPTGMTQAIFADLGLGQAMTPFLDRILSAFPAEDTDNLPRLQALTSPPDLWMCYGADSVFDRMQAERLQGIHGVTLSPIDGLADHAITPAMVADGSFIRLLFS